MPFKSSLPDLWRGGGWSPTREMSRLQRGIDRVFDDVMRPFPSLSAGFSGLEEDRFAPACDIDETESHFLVSFDLPGISKDEVKIEVTDNQLTVSGERKKEHREELGTRLSVERSYGAFQRVFSLPTAVDAEAIEADYTHGVLRIAVPKAEASKAKLIPVKEGKSALFDKLIGSKKVGKSEKAA